MEIGYNKDLLVLPFDHRGTFGDKMFNAKGRALTQEEIEKVKEFKSVIYGGFKLALQKGVPKEKAGILCDEQYGSAVLEDAKANGIMFTLPVEKSGQKEFDFEYGEEFGAHIEKFDPPIVKVLVRHNVEGDRDANKRQAERLKRLNDYLRENNRKYLFELLVPATDAQLQQFGGDKGGYDLELRPKLMVLAIKELHSAGISPDIWKLEGMEREEDVREVVKACRGNGTQAGVIVLGRGENAEKVKLWLKTGANIEGVIGFAIGRTVFWESLLKYYKKEISRDEAVEEIGNKYKEFVDLWFAARKG